MAEYSLLITVVHKLYVQCIPMSVCSVTSPVISSPSRDLSLGLSLASRSVLLADPSGVSCRPLD